MAEDTKRKNRHNPDTNTTGTDLEVLKNIDKIFKQKNPYTKKHSAAAIDWFRKYITRAYNRIKTSQMFRDRDMWVAPTQVEIGKLYCWEYDAKHKDTLPLWDAFPMVFPFSEYTAKDGTNILLGINVHWLPPAVRAAVMIELLKVKTSTRFTKNTKLEISWDVLKSLAQSKAYKHAVHAYRLDHFRSVAVEIPSQSWIPCIFLPLARWQKGSNRKAWAGL